MKSVSWDQFQHVLGLGRRSNGWLTVVVKYNTITEECKRGRKIAHAQAGFATGEGLEDNAHRPIMDDSAFT
jgi:hypothetical protein